MTGKTRCGCHLADGHLWVLAQQLCGMFQTAVADEAGQRLEIASLGEGCANTFFRQPEAAGDGLAVAHGLEVQLLAEYHPTHVLEQLLVGHRIQVWLSSLDSRLCLFDGFTRHSL